MQIGANGSRKGGHQPHSVESTGQNCSGNGVLGIPALICTRGAQEGPQPTAVEQRGDTSLLLQGQVPHPVPSAGVQGTPAAPFPPEIPLQEQGRALPLDNRTNQSPGLFPVPRAKSLSGKQSWFSHVSRDPVAVPRLSPSPTALLRISSSPWCIFCRSRLGNSF